MRSSELRVSDGSLWRLCECPFVAATCCHILSGLEQCKSYSSGGQTFKMGLKYTSWLGLIAITKYHNWGA